MLFLKPRDRDEPENEDYRDEAQMDEDSDMMTDDMESQEDEDSQTQEDEDSQKEKQPGIPGNWDGVQMYIEDKFTPMETGEATINFKISLRFYIIKMLF